MDNQPRWNETQAQRLRELLDDPVMRAALDIVASETVPEPHVTLGLGVKQAAIRLGYVTGRVEAIRQLRKLSRYTSTPPMEALEEWGYLTPEPEND